jgi:hypothetical protein
VAHNFTVISGARIGFQFNMDSFGNRTTSAKVRECKDCGRKVVRYAPPFKGYSMLLTVEPYEPRMDWMFEASEQHMVTVGDVTVCRYTGVDTV